MEKGRSAARVQRVQKVQRVVVAAGTAGCVEGLCSLRSGGDSACGAEGCGIALSGDKYYNAAFRRSRPHRVS